MTTDFLAWQSRIVNEYKRPDQFITHDLAGPPRPEINEHDIARTMDIMAANPYHGTQDHFDGLGSTMAGDYTRSLKRTNYLVTETNAQTIGWDSKQGQHHSERPHATNRGEREGDARRYLCGTDGEPAAAAGS